MDQYYLSFLQRANEFIAKEILTDVMRNGLSGEHHFLIVADTTHPQVELPSFLKEKHPEQITLLLQHQFENLEVQEQTFSVDLSFGGVFYNIKLPFSALLLFHDPSCGFTLSFKSPETQEKKETAKNAQIIDFNTFKHA